MAGLIEIRSRRRASCWGTPSIGGHVVHFTTLVRSGASLHDPQIDRGSRIGGDDRTLAPTFEGGRDGRSAIRHAQPARRLVAERADRGRPGLRAAAQADGVPEVAAALLPALEPAVRLVRRRLLGLDHPAGGHDADPVMGLAALALRGERRRGVPVLRRVRAASQCAQAAGAAVQVSREVPLRAAQQGVLVREPESRQHPAHLPVGGDDLDGRRGAGLVGLRQRLRAVAGLRRASRTTWRHSPWRCRSFTSSTSTASTG